MVWLSTPSGKWDDENNVWGERVRLDRGERDVREGERSRGREGEKEKGVRDMNNDGCVPEVMVWCEGKKEYE